MELRKRSGAIMMLAPAHSSTRVNCHCPIVTEVVSTFDLLVQVKTLF